MFYIKLFIKNTLTNLFSTYGGSHPINKQILNKEKWQRQEFTCPLEHISKSLVQDRSEGKGGGEEIVPIWVFILMYFFKAFRNIPPKKSFCSNTLQQQPSSVLSPMAISHP